MKLRVLCITLLSILPSLLSASGITPLFPAEDALLPLLNPRQKQFLEMPRKPRIAFFADRESRKELAKSAGYYPLPVMLSWKSDAPEGAVFTLKIGTRRDLSGSWTFTGKERSRKIDNLMIGTRYFWQVRASDGSESPLRSFRTEAQAPRLMRFPDVPNVRDLGGRKTLDGKRVRQNLVFRTAGLNDNAKLADKPLPGKPTVELKTKRGIRKLGYTPGKNRITPEGRRLMLEIFGIKSDIDLRSDRECLGMRGSPLGQSVTWFHYSSAAYGAMQDAWGKEAFKKVFRVFLDRKNYPILFHCIAGQDRTGAVAFIINGLLGVPEEELYLDWEATGFWNPSHHFCHRERFDKLVKGFEKLPGRDLQEKIEGYVLSLGFTRQEIDRLRAIMLE